jgi:hypothetical protein
VVAELGDPGRPPIEVLANPGDVEVGDHVTLEVLRACIVGGSRVRTRTG